MHNFYRHKKFALSISIILMGETHMTHSEPQSKIEVEFDLDISIHISPTMKIHVTRHHENKMSCPDEVLRCCTRCNVVSTPDTWGEIQEGNWWARPSVDWPPPGFSSNCIYRLQIEPEWKLKAAEKMLVILFPFICLFQSSYGKSFKKLPKVCRWHILYTMNNTNNILRVDR